MTESPQAPQGQPGAPQPTVAPQAVAPPPPPVPPPYYTQQNRGSRVTQIAAWVGIVAGVLFIVALVFFSGVALGRSGDGPRGWFGDDEMSFHHGGRGCPMMQGGPGMQGPMMPGMHGGMMPGMSPGMPRPTSPPPSPPPPPRP
ncbi:hypothetical protein ACQI4F_11615 [Mycolicibacterium vaccae]|uniref:hypothetical protein n=1 Tax=Mycolicibacterium vaccae TaxID=1810 RepID=UPI003CF8056C